MGRYVHVLCVRRGNWGHLIDAPPKCVLRRSAPGSRAVVSRITARYPAASHTHADAASKWAQNKEAAAAAAQGGQRGSIDK